MTPADSPSPSRTPAPVPSLEERPSDSLRDRLQGQRQRSPRLRDRHITLAHGSGGRAMRDLIADVFVGAFNNPLLAPLADQAQLDLATLAAQGDRLAMTTDTFVVDPIEFPGGDIGCLAVYGTVNDLAVGGAIPRYLSCGVILEEGLPVETLRRIVRSMALAAQRANVAIVTGDTKVVPRGSADKIFINTTGIGAIAPQHRLDSRQIQPGDAVLVSGPIGDHGAAILVARGELGLETDIASDCQPLHELTAAILAACPRARALRDATRGGVATVLNEFAIDAGVAIRLEETALPVRPAVAGLCEILGFDPLYLANEGTLVAVVPSEDAAAVLAAMATCPAGAAARQIGTVGDHPVGLVTVRTAFGTERIVDLLTGDQLPRIC
ncbi:MAG: hydrogenase expression/formation protein HypE [Cyanophyceae cyanobacterium]